MTPEQRNFRGEDARQLLANPILKEAFKTIGEYVDAQILSCDVNDKERAQRVVIAKQILAGIKREIERQVEDGEIARVQMAEIEKKRIFNFRR